MRFLSIGECMAELAPAETEGEFSLGFAGDTFNTAWYLTRIAADLDVAYLTAIGDDQLSDDLLDFMRESGIDATHVTRCPGKTVGLYMIHLAKGERSFTYWRNSSAARQLASDRGAIDHAMASADLIYFSGITLAILDAKTRATFLDAVRDHRASGKFVAFDTNLRPRLWSSPDDMRDTTMQAAACADVVLPSFDDEAEWFGDRDPRQTLERYVGLGVQKVVVKDGEQSVMFQDGAERGSVDVAPAARVVDSTAAGDSFNAGVLAGIMQGHKLASAIVGGCNLARQVVGHRGALVPLDAGSWDVGNNKGR